MLKGCEKMETSLIVIVLIVCICSLLVSFFALKKKSNGNGLDVLNEQKRLFDEQTKLYGQKLENTQQLLKQIEADQIEKIQLYNQNVKLSVDAIKESNAKQLEDTNKKLTELTQNIASQMEKLVATTNENLEKLRQNNEKKLDEIRQVVDEKLNSTLQDRLNKSFAIVSEQLQAVTKGLGEMQSLASGVGDLKRVITNVKTRGTFGEVQLGNILEQMLAPNQFASQVNTNPDNSDRVDYVVYLPGKDGKNIMLPIDAKFPMEDYTRLCDAYDSANADEIAKYQKALESRIKEEAKSIFKKYICAPNTTDFAIMYLATEGLYSETIKNTALVEKLQQENHILICGPTTISALVNSLQMGFKTLAIEKRSAEIWNTLSVFKKEFSTFVELLSKTQKKLTEASNTIDDATKKSQKISKQLSKVEDIDGGNNDKLAD